MKRLFWGEAYRLTGYGILNCNWVYLSLGVIFGNICLFLLFEACGVIGFSIVVFGGLEKKIDFYVRRTYWSIYKYRRGAWRQF
ncbi:MAG: hypothetical protein LBJ00_08050 [Planctomycetaceae bacterium]|nr:hypothetical protein [Planctomycetaceae bacterium]